MPLGQTIPTAIVECIAHAREPEVRELCTVADHIRSDLHGHVAGGAKLTKMPDAAARLLSLRAAHVALTGCA
jgi:hypothetical protein